VPLRTVGCVLAFGLGAFAQSDGPKVIVNLDGFRHPPIARQVRIQGDVVFKVSPKGGELISSANPLLTPAAQDNLKTWTLPPVATGAYIVTYHFKILDQQWCYDRRDPDPAPTYGIEKAENVKIDIVVNALPLCLEGAD
jgi:hypothetical protein